MSVLTCAECFLTMSHKVQMLLMAISQIRKFRLRQTELFLPRPHSS